jgi:RNA polymerase sigma factor (sigma-70 family)
LENIDREMVERAQSGSRTALENIVDGLQDRIYGLSLRMLYMTDEAEDATQEILIKIITRVGTYRGEGPFLAWVYRVAANHLRSFRRSRAERREVSLNEVTALMDRHYGVQWKEDETRPYQALVVEEARISCLHALLMVLNRDQRLALVLGVVFRVSSKEGAYALDCTPSTFRKRLSRARLKVKDFMSANCGLVQDQNRCRCGRSIEFRTRAGLIPRRRVVFMSLPSQGLHEGLIQDYFTELNEMRRVAALFRATPRYDAPAGLGPRIREMISSGEYRVLS